jgi:asparagine synthase (glutamine-hydrolysing)
LSADYFVENFAKAVWHFDFPLFSPTAPGALLLAGRARDYFTVFLSGDGADELLVGPPHLLNSMQNRGGGDGNGKNFSAVDLYIDASAYFNSELLMQMKPDFRLDSTVIKRKEIFDSGNGSFIRKSRRYELSTTLVDLLMRHEKMTMAQSMENRVPFLDHNVVDFVRRLPDKFLVQNGLSQYGGAGIILKSISEKYFGKEFANTTPAGLEIPLTDIYGNKNFRSWVLDTIVPGIRQRGIYNASLVEKHFSNLPAMSQHEGAAVWALISFETWARLFPGKKPLSAV